jgi:glyoxylase-like metal-dependent hydrolase (beta-lactamase superfamily II)
VQSWRIGGIRITKIVELEATGGTRFVLPHATREACLPMAWMKPHFMDDDGRLKMSVHALIVETPSRRILVDTCLGNDKEGRAVRHWNNLHGSFLRDLADAGFPRESIDTVVCTHLHVDHVGWNTMLVDGRWVPTFPNARYVVGATEFAYWRDQRDFAEQIRVFADSVQPVLDAGLIDLVADDHRVCEEVGLTPTVGHTPGHVSVRIASQGEEALITGDFLHHPCQMAHPDWAAAVDYDRDRSTRTRQAVFATLAGTRTLVIGTHFAGATAGYVVHDGEGYRLAT